MPTIYFGEQAVTVTQARYNQLIQRVGWYATPTRPTKSVKPIDDDTGVLNLREFKSADPKGVNDSTSAIQAAIDQSVSAGVALFVPPGTYMVKKLQAKTGLTMIGHSPSGYGIAYNKATTFGLIGGTNDHLLNGAVGVAHVRIERIRFDGNKNNNTSGNIINLVNAGVAEECQWHIRDCFMDAAAGYGIYVGSGRRAVQISDCTCNYSKLSGIRINGSDAHVDRCILGSNMEHGIGIGGTVCNVNDCDIYGNGTNGDNNTGDGITIYSTLNQIGIHGNRIDQNRRHGILVSGSNSAITITGNILHGNSQHANGSHDDIRVNSITGAVTVADNTFGVDGNVPNKAGVGVGLATDATVMGRGNAWEAGSTVNGLTNAPKRFAQTASLQAGWEPTAALMSNQSRATALLGNVAGLMVSGRLLLAGGLVLPAGVPITSISFLSGNTALGTPTNYWFCLVDQAGNVLRKTVDGGSAGWSGNAVKTLNLSSVYMADKELPVYLGIVCVGGTMPDLRAANASSPVFQIPPVVCGVANTGLTDPASLGATVGTISVITANPYCYVS